jgi:hypothetical protein
MSSALSDQSVSSTETRDNCTCRNTATQTRFDPACPFHGEGGTMIAVVRPTANLCQKCGSRNLTLDGWDIDKCQDCGHWRYRGQKSA